MTLGWRGDFRAVIASDVSSREGLGWEFTGANGLPVWAVFREDGGPFPVFSATRGEVGLPAREELLAMTIAAVTDLLRAAGLGDDVGWNAQNIAAGLMWAAEDLTSWEGEEWAIESDGADNPLTWGGPEDGRTPFAWLRARSRADSRLVGVYQDEGVFGLDFTELWTRELPSRDQGSLRSRRNIPLACGPVQSVEVVYDTLVEGGRSPGLVTEVLLHTERGNLLLLAAEAYGANEWHLFDESVVAIPEPERVAAMTWVPPRQQWRSAEVDLLL